jgi:hypothetical protein
LLERHSDILDHLFGQGIALGRVIHRDRTDVVAELDKD